MKRFKTQKKLNEFIESRNYDVILIEITSDCMEWYYVDGLTFEPLCYYLPSSSFRKCDFLGGVYNA